MKKEALNDYLDWDTQQKLIEMCKDLKTRNMINNFIKKDDFHRMTILSDRLDAGVCQKLVDITARPGMNKLINSAICSDLFEVLFELKCGQYYESKKGK